jgi:hypothetical protein
MARVGLVLALFAVGCGSSEVCDCADYGLTITYVLSTADVTPPDMLRQTAGFDLDGMPGTGTSDRCDDALDLTSSVTGSPDVDNQLSTNVGTILDGPEPRTVIEAQIASGELLLLLEVANVDSFTDDRQVSVRLIAGRVPAGATMPMTGADGRLTPGQTFAEDTVLATLEDAAIVAGRLELTVDALPIFVRVGEGDVALTVRPLRIATDIRATGLSNGELGGGIGVLDLLAFLEMLGTTTTEEELRAMLRPDLSPRMDDPATCDAVSLGFSFEAVTAANL